MTRTPPPDAAADLDEAWLRYLENVRWFGGKGSGARIVGREVLAAHTPAGVVPAVHSEVATLVHPDGHTEHYHLLVAHRPRGNRAAGAVIAEVTTPGGPVQVVDATTDPRALHAFVAATQPRWADVPVGVWPGEQSNTTLTLGTTHLYKLFRRLDPGPNLEVEVLTALAGGSVPGVAGRLTGAWPAGVSTDLGVVIDRVPDAADGWAWATEACASGRDVSAPLESLGQALRAVHGRLADAFGTGTRPGRAVAEAMASRLDAAAADAPELAAVAPALRRSFDALRGRTLAVQRIHGDFHLGQALLSPAGWTLIDFEGEPARPAAERREFDSPWRDVAGLLRSLDYVRGTRPDPDSDAVTAWAAAASQAFLKGYCGDVEVDDVLGGYVIDKAVYEVLYELRNRPAWVGIPMRAIAAMAEAEPKSITEKE